MTDKQLQLLLNSIHQSFELAYQEMYELMPDELKVVDPETKFSKCVSFTKPIVYAQLRLEF